ncbi:sensor histidine kinase [Pendulispora rubella]|uniref:histidine kinase n=1 Tax=Pendulispora rubella TaxID=2741070 RepID=A0ABZ2L528_9BACT
MAAAREPILHSNPSLSVAVVVVTFAGVVSAATSQTNPLSGATLAIVVALAVAYALLGTAGFYAIEQRGTRGQFAGCFAAAVLVGGVAVVLGRGTVRLMLMSVISASVLYLSAGGVILVTLGCAGAVLWSLLLEHWPPFVVAREFVEWGSGAAFVIIFSQMYVSQRRARAEATRLAKELEEFGAAKERNRIAREIHDGLGHYLTVVHVQLEAAQLTLAHDPEKAQGALARARELTHEILGEVRRSVAVLRGSAPRPLVEMLGKLTEECTDAGTPAHLAVEGEVRRLPDPTEYALYRTAQEALTNVRRHARASRVTVTLAFIPGERVRLRIEDDGMGMNGSREGFGLTGVRERADLLAGNIAIRTAPGQGFALEMEVPG